MTTAANPTPTAATTLPPGAVPFDPAGSAPIFVDTNVLVFAFSPHTSMHATAVRALARIGAAGAEAWISRQVIREYLVRATRPGPHATGPKAAANDIAVLESSFRVADETAAVTAELADLLRHPGARGKNVHDANLVATMLARGVGRLLTHNVSDFKRYARKISVEAL